LTEAYALTDYVELDSCLFEKIGAFGIYKHIFQKLLSFDNSVVTDVQHLKYALEFLPMLFEVTDV
jgi:hypothetical protein